MNIKDSIKIVALVLNPSFIEIWRLGIEKSLNLNPNSSFCEPPRPGIGQKKTKA